MNLFWTLTHQDQRETSASWSACQTCVSAAPFLVGPFSPVHSHNRNYSLSLRFNGLFPGEPGLADWFIEAKDDGGGGENWSYKTCKAPVKSSPPTNQHPAFYRLDALPVAQPSVKALKGKILHSMDLLTPSSPRVFQLCLWPLIAPGYLGEGCHASHQPSDASTHPVSHCVSKNTPTLASHIFNKLRPILITLGSQHHYSFKNDMSIQPSLTLHFTCVICF